MKHLFAPAGALFSGLLLSVVLCSSCQTNSKKKEVADTTSSINSPEIRQKIPVFNLNSLTVTAGVFKDNKNKNFLFEYFLGDETVTLYGWAFKKITGGPGQFSEVPDVKLTPFEQTTVAIGPGSFISDQMLSKNDVMAIANDTSIKKNTTLFFRPEQDSLKGRVHYKIYVLRPGQKYPLPDIDYTLSGPFSTNPSPPHQSFDSN